jgi:hypothetical protein
MLHASVLHGVWPAAAMYCCCVGCVLLQYLPDFKFWTAESSQRYAKAKDYPDRARDAIKEMHRQVLFCKRNHNSFVTNDGMTSELPAVLLAVFLLLHDTMFVMTLSPQLQVQHGCLGRLHHAFCMGGHTGCLVSLCTCRTGANSKGVGDCLSEPCCCGGCGVGG